MSLTKWREEQVLIICPGSQTTMAQLGCNELTPPARRFPTRMFPDTEDDSDNENETTKTVLTTTTTTTTAKTWRPYHTFKRTRIVDGKAEDEWVEDVDSDEGAVYPLRGGRIVNMAAFLAFLDHVHTVLTATYHNTPVMLMASPQWTRPDCEAIAQYVFERTRTPALCLIHSAIATQYGLKVPNMTVVDIGYEKVDVTAIYDGRVVNNVHVGAGNFSSSSSSSDQEDEEDATISGGRVFTRRLHNLLRSSGFTADMAEQLKRSPICEVLPYAPSHKLLMELPAEDTVGTMESAKTEEAAAAAAAVSAGPEVTAAPANPAAADEQNGVSAANGSAAAAAAVGDGGDGGIETVENDEGVLDVASIVTSGQTKEFLAKREKEKAAEKKAGGESVASKAARLPNSKRTHNSFSYEEIVQEEVPKAVVVPVVVTATATAEEPAPTTAGDKQSKLEGKPEEGSGAEPKPSPTEGQTEEQKKKDQEGVGEGEDTDAGAGADTKRPAEGEVPTAAAPEATSDVPTETRPKRVRRDIEVGPERFAFADRQEIDRIVGAIYHAIQGIDDMYMRPSCWENLVFVGNGARLRGLRENILQTLNARHLVSPSTATIFTSELPSNVATPTGTGSQTPTTGTAVAPGGPNPLLQAATTANAAAASTAVAVNAAGSENGASAAAAAPVATHHFHSQTPTAIKTVALPTYLQEWSKNGFEEAMFLGAQVASRIVFCLHSNMDAQSVEAQRMASLSRVDYKYALSSPPLFVSLYLAPDAASQTPLYKKYYTDSFFLFFFSSELGPKGIRNHSMLG
ncbi:actin-related protein 9 [Geosmithia morbida]|uniref:Actin-related protein 9 n=1 Tax=Geosmithia morbida TaxID=1094350 RepID=A0A9P5D7M0_9HYPO|nr:actin-related protein 9 [Geosmithia morbida]KAF4126766.1 actin-related protein 9 [Geosmithia morbida]